LQPTNKLPSKKKEKKCESKIVKERDKESERENTQAIIFIFTLAWLDLI